MEIITVLAGLAVAVGCFGVIGALSILSKSIDLMTGELKQTNTFIAKAVETAQAQQHQENWN